MGDKANMPRMREQWKDNAIEVQKYIPEEAALRRDEMQHKEAKVISNPKNINPDEPTVCPHCGDEGDDNGQA